MLMSLTQRLKFFCMLGILCVALTSQHTFAHSEAEKARFVSETGSDSSECNNRFRPCKTISYAVQKANKGDKILVAAGTYTIDSGESLLYLASKMQPIYGGYNVTDNYQSQSPEKFLTTLVGVPSVYQDLLYSQGFLVIADTKNQYKDVIQKGLNSISLMENTQAASPCTNGDSAGFDCQGLSLLGRLPLGELPTNSGSANDIWGHVDLNDMREYAIIGLRRGVVVADVTDPQQPVVIGSINGQSTTWRDIKVLQYYDQNAKRFKAYAYSGGDSITEGLSIIDLSMLPNSISLVSRDTRDRNSHNVYISNVDYTTNTALPQQNALLHVTGSQNFGGAWRTYTLSNPSTPQPAYTDSNGSRSDYTHDASSVLIDDTRVASDCQINDASTCNVILDFNENEIRLWEHNDANQAQQLSRATYPNLEYVHSGWWSEDKQYVFVHDELDEREFSLNTTLNIFDISNLRSPQLVATWRGPTRATDHNGFVRGNKYYMSNYERGVTVLDISDPTAPDEAGFFDTFGASNNASFNGVWGVYPYLPSGNILASDIQGGLYILSDDTLGAQDDAVGFAATTLLVEEGESVRLEVAKQGLGDVSVDYEVLYPSSSAQDISVDSGTLSWESNNTDSQFIDILIENDSNDEFDELFVVALRNPKNGDVINSKSHAFVTIDGTAINSGTVSFELASLDVLETQATANIRVLRVGGNEQALNVQVNANDLLADSPSDYAFANSQASVDLSWADGDSSERSIEIVINNDSEQESPETFTLQIESENTAALGEFTNLQITIKDDDSNTAPTVNAGDDRQVNARQTVNLTGASVSDAEQDATSLVLQWRQSAGPQVTLQNGESLVPRFTAPVSTANLSFELTVTDEFGISSTDSLDVSVVVPPAAPENTGGSGGGSVGLLLLFSMFVLAMQRRRHIIFVQAKLRPPAILAKA